MSCVGKKRFLDTNEVFRDSKRRLIDNFSGLKIGMKEAGGNNKSLFESDYLPYTPCNPPSMDRVIISNIDQFLRENPDHLDFLDGDKVDLENVDLNKLIIPTVSAGQREDQLNKLYDKYVRNSGALVKYYNPEQLTYERFLDSKDMEGKIVELLSSDEEEDDQDVDMDAD
ncbi:hypothetical protein OGAPHI_003192 [Ogataea philodendri]|uniref:Uncharacterized protein n=1 Tax=Ogataea philodendri TaxID=1378263 RepID=A0A9P8P6K2_9ASCO|nr:uncharacterized protein OGAPHI_003192 [Ogataea philodendri]KAH3666743.1 hypothetical protein OGAPHI_003192 [Ogataea philodendri]